MCKKEEMKQEYKNDFIEPIQFRRILKNQMELLEFLIRRRKKMLLRNILKCLVCGEDIDKGELICEECKGIEALDLVKLICRTDIKIPREYEFISIYKDSVMLAKNTNKDAEEPYVIWNIDYKGDVYSGSYFNNKNTAEKCYFNKLLNMI